MILFKSFQILVMMVTFIFTKLTFQHNIFTFTQIWLLSALYNTAQNVN